MRCRPKVCIPVLASSVGAHRRGITDYDDFANALRDIDKRSDVVATIWQGMLLCCLLSSLRHQARFSHRQLVLRVSAFVTSMSTSQTCLLQRNERQGLESRRTDGAGPTPFPGHPRQHGLYTRGRTQLDGRSCAHVGSSSTPTAKCWSLPSTGL